MSNVDCSAAVSTCEQGVESRGSGDRITAWGSLAWRSPTHSRKGHEAPAEGWLIQGSEASPMLTNATSSATPCWVATLGASSGKREISIRRHCCMGSVGCVMQILKSSGHLDPHRWSKGRRQWRLDDARWLPTFPLRIDLFH
jgi:hypothetical protein